MVSETELARLKAYRGVSAIPDDFDEFWDERMAEADAAPLEYEVVPADAPSTPTCRLSDIWFRGARGEKVYARYLRPRDPAGDGRPVPLVLRFHGYPGRTRSWFENCSFAGMGFADITMDNPGQGGRSQDVGGYAGTTVTGHVVLGLDGDPRDLYYVRLHQNVRVLCRIVRELPGIDLSRVCVYGDSQGGGVGLATCALNPGLVSRAAILYPFLSDFRSVWEDGADEVAYEGIRYYSRWFDADGSRADEWLGRLGYIDTLSFAHRVRCDVLFGTGLADTVCPPKTQFAVYNALTCERSHILYPDFGHEEIPAFDDEVLRFFWQGA